MKRRIAKKIVNRYGSNPAALSGIRRRGLVLEAYRLMGLPVPMFQDPEPVAVQPKVINAGTQNITTAKTADASPANILTNPTQDFDNLKVAELKALCKEQGIKGYSKLKRDGLIEALQKAS